MANRLGTVSMRDANVLHFMPPVLNTYTKTVHTSAGGDRPETAECGSLEHVSEDHIRVVDEEELRTDTIERCGNCFEDASGY